MRIKKKGITITINFLIIPMLILLTISGQLQNYLIVFACALLHEFGHAGTAKLLGMQVVSFELMPIGLTIDIKKKAIRRLSDEICLYISGPMTNLLIAAAAIVLKYKFFNINPDILNNFIIINSFLAGLNLLPAFPLDGGKILNSILSFKISIQKAYDICRKSSKIVAAAIIAPSILIVFYSNNISFLLVSMFLLIHINKKDELMLTQHIVDLMNKKMRANEITKVKMIAAQQSVKLMDLVKKFNLSSYSVIAILDADFKIVRIIGETDVIDHMLNFSGSASLIEL